MNLWMKIMTSELLSLCYYSNYIMYVRDRSWVKLADVNQVVISNRVLNHLQSRMVYFLMNVHIKKRNIYICRHGESEYNVQGRIGGDSELSDRGKKVRHKNHDYIII